MRFKHLYIATVALAFLLMGGCSSSNCPLDSTVTCNYGFYDSNGTAVTYTDTITVTTLLPGFKTVYTYKKLGFSSITLDSRNESLIEEGYTETVSETRKDTILINKLTKVSSVKIPMSYFHDTDTLIFKYASISGRDTLYIHHKSYPFVELPECGTYRFHTISSVESSNSASIDHVEVINKKVNYEGDENISIFFNGVAE